MPRKYDAMMIHDFNSGSWLAWLTHTSRDSFTSATWVWFDDESWLQRIHRQIIYDSKLGHDNSVKRDLHISQRDLRIVKCHASIELTTNHDFNSAICLNDSHVTCFECIYIICTYNWCTCDVPMNYDFNSATWLNDSHVTCLVYMYIYVHVNDSHVTCLYVNDSPVTCRWTTTSTLLRDSFTRDMLRSHVSWLINLRNERTPWRWTTTSTVLRDSFTWDMPRSHVTWLINMCNERTIWRWTTTSTVLRDSFTWDMLRSHVSWLLNMHNERTLGRWAMTSTLLCDSFTWDMPRLQVTWLIHTGHASFTCDVPCFVHMWRDSLTCAMRDHSYEELRLQQCYVTHSHRTCLVHMWHASYIFTSMYI